MQLALSDIKKYLGEFKAEEVEKLFNEHAFEVDEVEEVNGDVLFELDVLPNRSSDCLSVSGLLRELAVISNKNFDKDPLKKPVPVYKNSSESLQVSLDSEDAHSYIAAVFEGVKVQESPQWLQDFLHKYGQKPINNLVDITNFVLLFLGQPMHVFDADKLRKDGKISISVKKAQQNQQITTLDGKVYTLSEQDNIIFDQNHSQPIAIAGVKGGQAAEIENTTTRIVFESAKFAPKPVRLTSQRLKLKTDASKRFENEVPDLLPFYGMQLAIELAKEILGVEPVEVVQESKPAKEPAKVEFDMEKINQILGVQIPESEAKDILQRLGFSFSENYAIAPFWRTDISLINDLAEEVGRIYGLEKIKPTPIPDQSPCDRVSKKFAKSEKAREFFYKQGFTEVAHSTLTDKGELELANALASDKNHFRSTIKQQMLQSLEKNAKYAPLWGEYQAVKLFEIGSVYKNGKEQTKVCFGVYPLRKKKHKLTNQLMNEVIEKLKEEFGIEIGYKPGEPVVEFDLELIPEPESYPELEILPDDLVYKGFSVYPFVLRDIAFWSAGESEEFYLEQIKQTAGEYLVRADLFDRFEKDGRVSYAYHLVFQAKDRTLTDEEVNKVMEKVENHLKELGCEVR